MSVDTVLFLAFGVPLVCFVVGWCVFFGRRNGALKLTRREFLVWEAGLLFASLASMLLAHDIGKRM